MKSRSLALAMVLSTGLLSAGAPSQAQLYSFHFTPTPGFSNFGINYSVPRYDPFVNVDPLACVVIRFAGLVGGDARFENLENRSFPVVTTWSAELALTQDGNTLMDAFPSVSTFDFIGPDDDDGVAGTFDGTDSRIYEGMMGATPLEELHLTGADMAPFIVAGMDVAPVDFLVFASSHGSIVAPGELYAFQNTYAGFHFEVEYFTGTCPEDHDPDPDPDPNPVPEPGSLALLVALGVPGMLFLRRRR